MFLLTCCYGQSKKNNSPFWILYQNIKLLSMFFVCHHHIYTSCIMEFAFFLAKLTTAKREDKYPTPSRNPPPITCQKKSRPYGQLRLCIYFLSPWQAPLMAQPPQEPPQEQLFLPFLRLRISTATTATNSAAITPRITQLSQFITIPPSIIPRRATGSQSGGFVARSRRATQDEV